MLPNPLCSTQPKHYATVVSHAILRCSSTLKKTITKYRDNFPFILFIRLVKSSVCLYHANDRITVCHDYYVIFVTSFTNLKGFTTEVKLSNSMKLEIYLHISKRFLLNLLNPIFSEIFLKLFISFNILIDCYHITRFPTHKTFNNVIWKVVS